METMGVIRWKRPGMPTGVEVPIVREAAGGAYRPGANLLEAEVRRPFLAMDKRRWAFAVAAATGITTAEEIGKGRRARYQREQSRHEGYGPEFSSELLRRHGSPSLLSRDRH